MISATGRGTHLDPRTGFLRWEIGYKLCPYCFDLHRLGIFKPCREYYKKYYFNLYNGLRKFDAVRRQHFDGLSDCKN